jgi:hypothetical protein
MGSIAIKSTMIIAQNLVKRTLFAHRAGLLIQESRVPWVPALLKRRRREIALQRHLTSRGVILLDACPMVAPRSFDDPLIQLSFFPAFFFDKLERLYLNIVSFFWRPSTFQTASLSFYSALSPPNHPTILPTQN